jgi:hypothetical protein
MSEQKGIAVSGPSGRPEPVDPEDIKRDIEKTRAELGETVEALAQKVNVPAQVKAKAADVQAKATEAAHQAMVSLPEPARVQTERALGVVRAKPLPVLLGALGAVALIVVLSRARRRK